MVNPMIISQLFNMWMYTLHGNFCTLIVIDNNICHRLMHTLLFIMCSTVTIEMVLIQMKIFMLHNLQII